MRHYFFISVFVACTIFSSCESKKNGFSKDVKRNVLFIMTDDLNCDLGSYKNNQVISPNIDGLAAQGFVFDNAHVQWPQCGQSRASFMTSMYSDQTKHTKLNVDIRTTIPDVITLGQRFRQRGYTSVRIGKIYHYDNPGSIGTSSADDIHTWDYTINPYGRDKEEEYKIKTLRTRSYGGTLSWLKADGLDEEQTDGIAASEAIEQLDKFSKSKQNFFLAVGFYKPHTPYVAPRKYFDMYDLTKIDVPEMDDNFLKTIPKPAAISLRHTGDGKGNQYDLKKIEAQEIKRAYYATISFLDAQIGRILKKLKDTGLDKNTIVVFSSDHGYHLGEKGHWQKQTLYEKSTRVPLIFSGPEIEAGKRSNSPVELIDIYPTLMDLTQIQKPDHVVGKSLVPIFNNPKHKIRNSALTRWILRHAKGKSVSYNGVEGYSIKTDRYRLVEWGENGNYGYELYDHKYDKKENKNLALDDNYKSVLDSLKTEIGMRIKNARTKPKGLGRQLEEIPYKRFTYTPGDLYDKKGKRVYLKPADE